MDSASDSLEIEGFSVLASHSASDTLADNGGRGGSEGSAKLTAILMIGPAASVSGDANPTLSLTSIRMNIYLIH